MTRYEKEIEQGTLVPMNGLDWLMLQVTLEGVLDGTDKMDDQLRECLNDMMLEIEHYYDDDKDTLEKLVNLINND